MTPKLGSPRNVLLTVTVLWDLVAVGMGVRIYKNWKRRQG
jgi:hypothetical protein